MRLAVLLTVLLAATGCGQTGPLTLPDRDAPNTALETAEADEADEEDDD
jgi:predicted small lipoprotein YifL